MGDPSNPYSQLMDWIAECGSLLEAQERGEELGETDRQKVREFKEYFRGLAIEREPERQALREIKEAVDPGYERYWALVRAWNACPEKFREKFVKVVMSLSPIEEP